MTVTRIAVVTLALALFSWGCDQGDSESEQKNQNDESIQEEQGQMPDETEPKADPFGQPQATEVSDKELEKFAVVAQEAQVLNQEVQQEMMNTLEEQGMGLQRYNEIHQAQQNPQLEVEASTEELEKLEATTLKFETIQEEAQERIEEKVAEVGLTMSRYEEIIQALQSDPDLQGRFRMIQQQENN